MLGMREMFLDNGFDDFLAKPIEVRKLHKLLEKWVPDDIRAKAEANPSNQSANPGVEIEGIDVLSAISRVGGNYADYIETLEFYCRDADTRLPALGKLPVPENLKTFVTNVHALKSASANIGAENLARMASLLENAGDSGEMEFIRENLKSFREDLAAMTERIRTAIARTMIGNAEANALRGEIVSRLVDVLESGDIDEIDGILDMFRNAELDVHEREALSRISELVLMGEFKEAAAAAKALDGSR
jgi:HPt (histidine-containing phosphotransfer) domain-containing protein